MEINVTVAVEVSEYKLSDKFKDLPFECSFWDLRPAVGNIQFCNHLKCISIWTKYEL